MQKSATVSVIKRASKSSAADDRSKQWENQIKTLGQAFCGKLDCNYIGMTLADMENHIRTCKGVPNFSLFCCIHCRCGFSTKEDHLKHQQNCSVAMKLNSKKVDNLHFRVIKQMKNKDSSEDHIIQPGPDLPKGQYRRRRAYRAEHKNSWALTLEKFKYVKCIYQNCYFIAMSLEDMISHFGYCNGDGSFAKFVCPYCNGRVTSETVLLKHIERSHFLENSRIKIEPSVHKSNSELLNLETHDAEETNPELKNRQNIYEMAEGSLSIRKVWEDQIDEFGYAFCRKSLCNFMSPSITDLEIHLKSCDGTPDFETLNCPKCRYRLPTKEDFVRHVPFCKDERVKYFSTFGAKVADSQHEGVEEDDFEIGPVLRQYQNKWQASSKRSSVNLISQTDPLQQEDNSCESGVSGENTNGNQKCESNLKNTTLQKTRGRPKKTTKNSEKNQGGKIKCGKCDFQGSKSSFVNHNLRVHVGLGWIEGEEPVDLNDEKLVIRLVKEAFRLTKKASCDKCDDVKRSVMGFVSHIQNCGKSEEEKIALKVQCPHCEGRYLKYSLGSHIKICHPNPEEEEKNEIIDSSGKRRSAIKAVSKFHQALTENDEVESNQESHYIFYERGSERIPKLNSKLNNLWYKLKRENKKIPCRHANCTNLSNDVKQAKTHHYSCPLLPEKVFMCELCDFYSVDEPSVQVHVTTHRKYVKQKKTNEEEEEVKMDEEGNEGEDDNEGEEESRTSEEEVDDLDDSDSRKRKRKKESDDQMTKKLKFSIEPIKPDLDIEFRLKQSFCRREKIDNVRGIQFYSNGLEMTFREEEAVLEDSQAWPELHTSIEDWSRLSPSQASEFFPKLTKSVSVHFSGSEIKWRRLERFEGLMTEGGPVIFTGGSVRSMSWCKVSFKRMFEKTQRQYLAVTTAQKFDHLKDMYEKSSLKKPTLLQIWDCGGLDNNATKNIPKFSLGIIQEGGEIWCLAWFPIDTYAEAKEHRLRRLGLLATGSEDGCVRVWSICDPEQLENTEELPIYSTQPIVTLIADKDVEESCFQLAVGTDGIIAGGFSNGTVAVWNLKNISSPFCKTTGKTKIIRAHLVFQAHKTAVTALTFCPSNSRYLSTSGLDRFVKIWDLEFPSVPIEQYNKEYSLDNIWTLNWPSLIYNFDDVMVNFNKGAVKFIKDILTDRHMSTFAMEDTCLSLSFSDWLNTLCGGSITGEVKLRLLKNLIHDQKRHQSTISSVKLEKLKDGNKEGANSVKETTSSGDKNKNSLRSYDEINSRFGLAFKDNLGIDKGKPKKPEAHPEEFPIRAVNKVVFNPNFKSFTHLAVGYNCGLVRIQPLKELQSSKSLKFFLEKTQPESF